MFLYIVRHAASVNNGAFVDADRPLTPQGEAQATWLGELLRGVNPAPGTVWCSPALRCRATAELLAAGLDLPPRAVRSHEALVGGNPTAAILQALAELRGVGGAVVIGHQPEMETLTSLLLGGTSDVRLRFRHACCASLQVDAMPPTQPALLQWFLGPQLLQGRRGFVRR